MVFLFISFFIVLVLLIYFSKIQVEIINFRFLSNNKERINEGFKIIIRWYILEKIKILQFKINKNKIKKFKKIDAKIINKTEKLVIKKIGEDKKNIINMLKNIKITTQKIDLYLEIGTDNSVITAMIVSILSIFLGIFFGKNIKNCEKEKFIIMPIYINKNLLNVMFSGIFEIKLNHIISVLLQFAN